MSFWKINIWIRTRLFLIKMPVRLEKILFLYVNYSGVSFLSVCKRGQP